MGKGVALQFKRAFPTNFKVYRAACEKGEVKIGRMFVFDAGQLMKPRYIINFQTKAHWKVRSRLADVETGQSDLRRVVEELGLTSVRRAPVGLLGRWARLRDVRPLIANELEDLEKVRVLVYEPRGAPRADQMEWGPPNRE